MRKTETLFIGAALVVIIAVTGGAIWYQHRNTAADNYQYPTTQFGAFLAAQHAIYVNDFDAASNFAAQVTNTE